MANDNEIQIVIQVATAQGKAQIKDFTNTSERELKGFRGNARKYLGMAGVAGIVATATGTIVAGFNRAMEKGREFQSSLAELEAITGISGDQLDQLADNSLELSKEYGAAASQIIEANKLVASQLAEKIDFNTAEGLQQLQDVSEQATILKTAAGIDLKTAVETTTSVINQFGLAAEESSRVINTLAAGSKYGAAEVGDINRALVNAGSAAAGAKQSIETTNAAIQVLAANGQRGERAGTALRAIFTRLQTSGELLAENGIKNVNLESDGLVATLEKLEPLLEDTAAMKKIFGEEALNQISILIREADAVESLTEKVTGTQVAHEQAAVQMDTFDGAMNRLWSAIDAELIPAFTETNGILVNMMGRVADAVEGFSSFVSIANQLVGVGVVEELENEREEFNRLYTIATNVNTSQEDRIDLIRTMKREYPDFLEGINAEKVSNEELRDVLEEVNKAYENRINTQKILTPVEEAYESAITASRRAQEKESQVLVLLEKAYRNNREQLKELGFETENFRENLSKMDGEEAERELTLVNTALDRWINRQQAADAVSQNVIDSSINPMSIALSSVASSEERLATAREEARKQLENLGFSQERINELLKDFTLSAEEAESATESSTEAEEEAGDEAGEHAEQRETLNDQIKENEERIELLVGKQESLTKAEQKEVITLKAQNDELRDIIENRKQLGDMMVAPQKPDDETIGADVDVETDAEPDFGDPIVREIDRVMLKSEEWMELERELQAQRKILREADGAAAKQQAEQNIDAIQAEMQARAEMERAFYNSVNAQIESLEDFGNVVIQQTAQVIKAHVAEAVATQALKALSSVPFPFNIAAASAAGATISALFSTIVPEFASGGKVYGPGTTTSDSILARLSDQEYVVNAASANAMPDALEAANANPAVAGTINKIFTSTNSFAGGGRVGSVPNIPSESYMSLDKIDRIIEINRKDQNMEGFEMVSQKLEEQTKRLEQVQRNIELSFSEFEDTRQKYNLKEKEVGRG